MIVANPDAKPVFGERLVMRNCHSHDLKVGLLQIAAEVQSHAFQTDQPIGGRGAADEN